MEAVQSTVSPKPLKPYSLDTEGRKYLSIKTLGSFNLYFNGHFLDSTEFLKRKRVQDLLILLILNRKDGLQKETIFNIFWKNYTDKSRKDNLNTLIYRLKKLLGNDKDLLIINRNTIRLDPFAIEVDADTFTKSAQQAELLEEAGELEQALLKGIETIHLYRGEFFENICSEIPIESKRSEYRGVYLSTLFRMERLYLIKGFYKEALKTGKTLISHDPYCEPAHRLLMTTLGYLGNSSEILRLYHSFEQKLFNAFGIAPDAKTETLKNRLLLGVFPSHNEILDEVSVFF